MDSVVSVIPNQNHKLQTSRHIYMVVIFSKIVGARYFRISGVFGKEDIISPIDTVGHGSHCASIAGGNPVKSASVFGYASGTARGGVPLARIAAYKVCWEKSCDTADILAAYDQAITDGVDILSVSMGSAKVIHQKYFEDINAIGAFHAMKKGILTSKSADNSGPDPYSISNTAPWFVSVAATTIDRRFFTNVQLGNGQIFKGASLNTFDLQNKRYPLIYAGNAPNVHGGFNSSVSRYCLENALDATLVKGKIVLCDDFPYPSIVGLAHGAAGVIYRSNYSLADAKVFALPAVHISPNDGKLVYSYLNSTSNPTATIFKSYEGKDSSDPFIIPFSSRGPNKITPDLLKPDLAAPGVDILAAWPPNSPISGVKGDSRMSNYNIQSGTSMACPHVTAAAAYVKTFHPTWSPAAIKSALMTTGNATPMNSALNKDAEFAYGAGEINPIKAANPGLVYDAAELDYVKFLCGQGYTTRMLQKLTGDNNSSCTQANRGTVWDLNLPSFALSTTRSKYTSVTFSRTVTNVGSATSKYKATISTHPSTLNIQVVPDVLVFSSLGQTKSFTLKIEGSINENVVSSSLVWDDGTFQVRSPIVVYVL
ncbi:hypothetical protein CR513_40266, partial [Mucuna pruriens]